MVQRLRMPMKYYSFIFYLFSILFSHTGYEIAERMTSREAPLDIKSKLIMTLEDKDNNKMESIIRSQTKDNGKKQIMWFLYPPDSRGISLYKIENKKGRDIMKMWLPAFKKIRKISSSRKSDNFMGSDLSFEDLYSRELDDYSYTIEFIEESNQYVMTSIPKENIKSSYSKHISWINKDNLLINKEESYNKSGSLFKTKEFKYINIDGFDLVEKITVVDIKKNHKTYLKFAEMILNSGLKDSDFHEKNLRRIPIDKDVK